VKAKGKGKVKNLRGSILIVTLWALAILLLLAVGLAYRVGLELHLTRYAADRLKAFYVAKAGLERAEALLLEEGSSEELVDSFQEKWSKDETLFKEKEVGGGFFSVSYSSPQSGDEKRIRYGMEDEESRIPLNSAGSDILQKIPGLEEEVVKSIRAWRGDKDLTPEETTREDNYYASLEKPYSRKGKPLETVEELLLVRGVTLSLYNALNRFLTVYGSGKVNLNTASAETLEYLGLPKEIVQRIVELRKGEDGALGTPDDTVFKKVPDLISPEIIKSLRLDQDQQLGLTNFLSARQGILAVQSTAFRIQSEGLLRQGGVKKRIVAIVDRSQKKTVIKYWHED